MALRRDLEQNFKGVLQSQLAQLDLVTREEFDVQAHGPEAQRARNSRRSSSGWPSWRSGARVARGPGRGVSEAAAGRVHGNEEPIRIRNTPNTFCKVACAAGASR